MPLRTERMCIDALRPDDIATIVAYRNDPEVSQHQAWPLPFTAEMAARLVAEAGGPLLSDGGQFAMRLTNGDGPPTMVGDVMVRTSRRNDHVRELGITLSRPAWGKGYATEALTAVLDALFDDARVEKVLAHVFSANDPSLRLFERLGFAAEGRLAAALRDRNGEVRDEVLFGITRARWRPATRFDVVAFDADDTLWHSEDGFHDVERLFDRLVGPHAPHGVDVAAALTATERKNLAAFGYGVKSFTLSMVEAAITVTSGSVPTDVIARLVDAGRELLLSPVRLLDGVPDVLEAAGRDHRLVLITKGDLIHQNHKVTTSGIAHHFEQVEIVLEKDPETYQRIVDRLGVRPERFCMVGNSVRSDVLPVLSIGAHAVHVPYPITWALERVDEHSHQFDVLTTLRDLVPWLSGEAPS